MKRWGLLYILINIVSCQSKETAPDCVKFRTGKFWYKGFIIERNDSVQTEKHSYRGLLITKRIHWINDCEYELTFLSAKHDDTLPGGKKVIYERKDKTQKIKIVETTKDYYIFESVTSTGEPFRDKVEILKIGGFKSIGDIFPTKK